MEIIEIEEIPFYYPDKDNLVGVINALLKVLSADKPSAYEISLTDLARVLDDDNFRLYLIKVDGKIAGMASLNYHRTLTKWAAYMEDVVLFPEFQGKGLGEKLVNHLDELAKDQGVKFIELTSHPRRVAANALYEKLGFVDQETNLKRLFFKR
jgi:ribosomal protein S18 acetylase RimI-like enzyme